MTQSNTEVDTSNANLTAEKEPPFTANYPPNLRRWEASRYLRERYGIHAEPPTLAKWFCLRSDGPPAFKDGRVPLYPRQGLDDWAVRRLGPLRRSTSDVLSTSETRLAARTIDDRDTDSLPPSASETDLPSKNQPTASATSYPGSAPEPDW